MDRRRFLFTLGAASAGMCVHAGADDSFKPLFDGKSLAGWHKTTRKNTHGSGGRWAVAEGGVEADVGDAAASLPFDLGLDQVDAGQRDQLLPEADVRGRETELLPPMRTGHHGTGKAVGPAQQLLGLADAPAEQQLPDPAGADDRAAQVNGDAVGLLVI